MQGIVNKDVRNGGEDRIKGQERRRGGGDVWKKIENMEGMKGFFEDSKS